MDRISQLWGHRDGYGKYFSPMQHIEDHWLESRLGSVARPVPRRLKQLLVNKLAGMVFTCTKKQLSAL